MLDTHDARHAGHRPSGNAHDSAAPEMEINGIKRVQSTMAKYSKPEVSYRPAIGGAKRRCSNCINYQETESGCTMVEGSIKPNFVCNLWKLKLPPALEEMRGEDSG